MTQLPVAMVRSYASRPRAAWALLSLGAACATGCGLSALGESASDGGTHRDAHTSTDGSAPRDSGSSRDGRDHDDGGSPTDGAHAADVARPAKGDSGADGGGDSDSGETTDGMMPTDGRLAADGSADAPNDDGPMPDGTVASPALVFLGTAGDYVILTETGISIGATTAITGDLGVSPAAAGAITGFSLSMDPSNLFSTSALVSGKVYAANYMAPTPSNLGIAIGDMENASVDAAGRAPNFVGVGTGNIGGMTLGRGVYAWSTGLLIPDNVTLTGSATDVFIFQVAQTLTMSASTSIILKGGVTAENVFWEVAGSVSLDTGAHLEGVMLASTSVALGTSASIKGRLLAQTAVTLASSDVVGP
jgi:hypothetical protein